LMSEPYGCTRLPPSFGFGSLSKQSCGSRSVLTQRLSEPVASKSSNKECR